MRSMKKSYARHLLQLALTLSLLRVDPENYIGYGWESQLALQNGDGWQLELRAAPLNDFPYSNRKVLIPLIDDLVRFDRMQAQSMYDVQTYLLNVQNEQISLSNAPSAPSPPPHIESNNSIVTTIQQQTAQQHSNESTRNTTEFIVPLASGLSDPFTIQFDQSTDDISVFDQTIADLNDYNDGLSDARNDDTWNLNQLYAGLPLKDEPSELFSSNPFDLLRPFSESDVGIGDFSTASTSSNVDAEANTNNMHHMLRSSESPPLNLSQVIDWTDYFANSTTTTTTAATETSATAPFIKLEAEEDSKNDDSGIDSSSDENSVCVKVEQDIDDQSSDGNKNSTSTFSSNVELTEEESEIVEVLWKQDVDLGYSLAPIKTDLTNTSSNANATEFNAEDNEKLKVLQDLKNDKLGEDEDKPPLDDVWDGINFMVDNETGEYIQRPLLEEFLQDVLADLTANNDQVDDILAESSTASTSSANQLDANIEQSTVDKANSLTNNKEDKDADTDTNDLPFFLDALTEEEISANLNSIIDEASELDAFDMMIQSSGPFSHPRSVAQNYAGHPNPNMYHRQPPYHPHHPQSRLSLSRAAASMEQRRLEFSSFFSPLPGMGVGMNVPDMAAYPHYPPHYPYQGASSLSQHDQYASQHMAIHNAAASEMAANQSIGSIGTSIPSLAAQQQHYPIPNLGTAVSSSMHLTNSSHDSDVLGAASTNYKTDEDMMYYSNSTSVLNQTTDGFINDILNDEDLFNESYYALRMLEPNPSSSNAPVLGTQNNGVANINAATGILPGSTAPMQTLINGAATSTGDRLDASSDSAVSSMGSERVPSLSDSEWCDAGSDSAQEYHHSKYGPYDYSSYNGRLHEVGRIPVTLKKHHLYGKQNLHDQNNTPNMPQQPNASNVVIPPQSNIKYELEPYPGHHPLANGLDSGASNFQIQDPRQQIMNKHQTQQQNGEMKYSCSIDFARPSRGIHDIVGHNHSYALPQASAAGATPRALTREKKLSKKAEEEHLTRDEKRARTLRIPIEVADIINLPMDEFNERLSKFDLNENQLSLIRDIRRRGKNKVAAQNCRKRKLDQIHLLEDEVEQVQKRKERLIKEKEMAEDERTRIKRKCTILYNHIFQHLRDPHGNLYSQYEYTLQQSADGGVHLLRRENSGGTELQSQQQRHMQHSQQSQNQLQQNQPSNTMMSAHHHQQHHHNPHH